MLAIVPVKGLDGAKTRLAPRLSAAERASLVVEMLERNQSSLDRSVKLLAPYVRVFTNTLGNGRWFDSFVNDLLPTVIGAALCGPTEPVAGCTPTEGGAG